MSPKGTATRKRCWWNLDNFNFQSSVSEHRIHDWLARFVIGQSNALDKSFTHSNKALFTHVSGHMPQHCHTATMSPSRATDEDESPSRTVKNTFVGRTYVWEGSNSEHSACASRNEMQRRFRHSIRKAPFALMARLVAVVSSSSASIITDADKINTRTIVQTALLPPPHEHNCVRPQQCTGTRADLLKCLCRCWHAQCAW